MMADVSHELKTPLTAMRGSIETLRMPEVALDADRRDRYFETIDRETRRLERIVKELPDLARYEPHARRKAPPAGWDCPSPKRLSSVTAERFV